MYCQICGTFNDGDRKTCRGCGTALGRGSGGAAVSVRPDENRNAGGKAGKAADAAHKKPYRLSIAPGTVRQGYGAATQKLILQYTGLDRGAVPEQEIFDEIRNGVDAIFAKHANPWERRDEVEHYLWECRAKYPDYTISLQDLCDPAETNPLRRKTNAWALGLTLASAVLLLLTLKAFAFLLSLGAMVLILFSLRKRFDTGTVLLFVFAFICCMTACVRVFG